jgi:HD superfamily phosphohydrolase/uncharacterized protein YjbK
MKKDKIGINGKIIRDPVHGDIFIPQKFIKIIDTPEFQRLRRIHQLSTSYLVFPGAEHTRFSHSIGTFFVMQKIIEHFKKIMSEIGIELKEKDINLALAAALLHDLGHGPFSHAFEKIFTSCKHEEWTTKIIESDTIIYKVLKDEFYDTFPNEVADLIKKHRVIEEKGMREIDVEKIDLFFILSSLISSQLDADRMDYLVRDSFFTGAFLGKIDISRLINSMTLSVYKNKYYVCVYQKYLTDIERYLLARYQMLKEVYLHDLKCETEMIINKILMRGKDLFKEKDKYLLANTPQPFIELLKNEELDVNLYLKLDDHLLLTTFTIWKDSKDITLSTLCECIINRGKYEKIKILNNNEEDIQIFKNELLNILKENNYHSKGLDSEYFWLEIKEKCNIYNKEKENIWVLKNNGTINDFADVSKVVKEELNGVKIMTYIQSELIQNSCSKEDKLKLKSNINNLIKSYNNRNHIEIEKKFILKDESAFNEVIEKISTYNEKLELINEEEKLQEDYYFDTENMLLHSTNKTLRIRKKNDNYFLTIKTPTKGNDELSAQSERFEYEISINSKLITDYNNLIIKYLPELNGRVEELKETLTIRNKRKKIELIESSIRYEIVLDNVIYINQSGDEAKDIQVEIELKSDYLHRVNLKMLTDYLEKKISSLEPLSESKYKRGLSLLTK